MVNLPFAALPGAANQGAPAGGISFGFVSGSYNINLALQALAAQGKARTLSRPETSGTATSHQAPPASVVADGSVSMTIT